MVFRKATVQDIPAIERIYEDIHTEEEAGRTSIGWIRGVYPTRKTAEASLARGDLFVAEDAGMVVGTAIINQQQVDAYKEADWHYPAKDDEVMVLHTLVIAPQMAQRGFGKGFVTFYEDYARQHDCLYLRMDTNARNLRARAMYQKLGYQEIGIVPCVFNGIDGVQLVLLEKKYKTQKHCLETGNAFSLDKTVITVYNQHIQLRRGDGVNILIDNKSGAPIYDQIYSQIKRQIISGALLAHEMLPSIRGLAKDLRISFITTKRAYDELEKDGFIYTIQAKGCYVAPKNVELLREEHLKEIETHMERIVQLAAACNLGREELLDMMNFALEERV